MSQKIAIGKDVNGLQFSYSEWQDLLAKKDKDFVVYRHDHANEVLKKSEPHEGYLEFNFQSIKDFGDTIEDQDFFYKPENKKYLVTVETWHESDERFIIERDDPDLVEFVEQLDDARRVVEIPDDIEWHIRHFEDGLEAVAENHRMWF